MLYSLPLPLSRLVNVAGQVIPRGKQTWLVRVFLGRDTVTGKRRFFNQTVHGRKRDAVELCTRLLRERDTGRLAEPTRESVSEFLDRWIATKVRLRERTRADYKSLIDRHLRPRLGPVRLSRLTSAQIQAVCGKLLAAGLSPRTIKYVHDVLRMALNHAVRTGVLARNPTDLVELPQLTRGRAQSLSPNQVAVFLEYAREDRYYALWLLLVTSGLRPSEALGLRWSDIDLERRTLVVRRVLVRVPGMPYSFEDPKTRLSARTVALLPTAVSALKRHRIQQAEVRLASGPDGYENQDLVFAAGNGAPLDYRVIVRRHFKLLVRRAGLPPFRPYDLRHTSATLALVIGTPVKVVMEQLGHSTVKQTLDTYQHVLPNMQERAAEALEAFLFPVADKATRTNT